ncbi:DUF452 family protein [Spirabiliibacterium falconis]|uniref:DUF452 family protein n=1 Tax=Spirabiliibacterium falconis TaxID=572023 RepID=UPI001AADCECD|nr:pimeloyl-ACP methyl esterase BioG family protein [Spirabiliibacterium falconis]MBE2894337.1 DUF452 family protein [Spirabiliibacterium falconis]
MQCQWLKCEAKRKLILYFAGWGTNAAVVADWAIPEECDLLVCFDYRSLDFSHNIYHYDDIIVVAWSLGVWVAQQTLAHDLPIRRAIAINGTGKPMDDAFGIPIQIFDRTLEQLDAVGRAKFERRMCGSREQLQRYQALPQRELAEIQAELTYLADAIKHTPYRTFHWTHAIIGEKDFIFPAANQWRYFHHFHPQCERCKLDAPHLVFSYFSSWQALCQQP